MKKLIAIAVVFALVAGAAFAEISVSGSVQGSITLGAGSTEKDSETSADGHFGQARIETSGQNDDGTFGGWSRFQAGSWGGGSNAWGLAWWKPIDQLKIQIGANPDGHFGADGFSRWNFYQVAADVGVASEGWKINSMYGGMGAFGTYLFITPVEGLEINIGIPFNGGNPKYSYFKTNAQVAYNISGIGRLALSFTGNLGDAITVSSKFKGNEPVRPDATDADKYPLGASDPAYIADLANYGTDYGVFQSGIQSGTDLESFGANGGKVYLYFGLTAIENLGVDIGFGYTFPVKADSIAIGYKDSSGKDATYTQSIGDDVTVNSPIAIGLGVNFNAGAFGIKARFQGVLGGTVQMKGLSEDVKSDTKIIFDIQPSFAINDNVAVLLSAGLNITTPGDNKGQDRDTVTSWHINPYLTVKTGWWAPSFYVGFRMESDGKKGSSGDGDASKIDWKIPVGMAFGF